MNHPKAYFTTPLSRLAKQPSFDTSTQVDKWDEEYQGDEGDEVQTYKSPLTIIQSRLNATIIEEFIFQQAGLLTKKQDWKDEFIWL
ncbi:unnamed protein product (macronuclear) [Paramecium tetraurelia]|uniref:Uncharacterized protein n=1 Tax=Paramecium tetraurelia TaxID=5888 RepID=A0BGT4_PARTE|nr:uncharacterized protein GSPATT00028786001 [Paramecium tetraurelia]CAK57751.1 unnamed protein product [Paramecium tetraurelia]|eukprot:XP_001425149.1 hypothetical protein (macronuclear) [Paramecium tetraurelia strain d4-2]